MNITLEFLEKHLVCNKAIKYMFKHGAGAKESYINDSKVIKWAFLNGHNIIVKLLKEN